MLFYSTRCLRRVSQVVPPTSTADELDDLLNSVEEELAQSGIATEDKEGEENKEDEEGEPEVTPWKVGVGGQVGGQTFWIRWSNRKPAAYFRNPPLQECEYRCSGGRRRGGGRQQEEGLCESGALWAIRKHYSQRP